MREALAATDAKCMAEVDKCAKEQREATRKMRSLIISQGEKIETMVGTLREDTENGMTDDRLQSKADDERMLQEAVEQAGHMLKNLAEKVRYDLKQSEASQRAQFDMLKSMLDQQGQFVEARQKEFREFQEDQRERDDQQ